MRSRRIIMVLGIMYLLRKAYKHVKLYLQHQQLVKRMAAMPIYSVAEVKQLLMGGQAGQKIRCFVRGLITSKNAFESALQRGKKLVWSLLVRRDIYSNRPKEIIDTLELADKIVERGPKVAKHLCLRDLAGTEIAQMVQSPTCKLSITSALTEIAVSVSRYPATIFSTIRSFFAKMVQFIVLIGRLAKGASIKKVLIQLGAIDGSHMLVLGDCSLSATKGLVLQAEVATKDVELYLKRLSAQRFVYVKQFMVFVTLAWVLLVFFSNDLKEMYEYFVQLWKGNDAPDSQLEQQRQDNEDNTFSCYICYTKIRKIIFLPCRHYGVCRSCYQCLDSKECPTCKADIQSTLEVRKEKVQQKQ